MGDEQPGRRPARVIGLTGNIACGKSTVLRVLADLGATTVDADQVTREVMEPGGPAYPEVVRLFGPDILTASGEIDRRHLGDIVFSDPPRLRKLEAAVHPWVRARIQELIHRTEGALVLDAIKLIESGLYRLCDEVWVVTCRPEQQLRRLHERNGYTEEEALLRIRAQSPQEEKMRFARVIIDNSGSLEDTREQVLRAWRRLPAPIDHSS